jgi:hypothetical protein
VCKKYVARCWVCNHTLYDALCVWQYIVWCCVLYVTGNSTTSRWRSILARHWQRESRWRRSWSSQLTPNYTACSICTTTATTKLRYMFLSWLFVDNIQNNCDNWLWLDVLLAITLGFHASILNVYSVSENSITRLLLASPRSVFPTFFSVDILYIYKCSRVSVSDEWQYKCHYAVLLQEQCGDSVTLMMTGLSSYRMKVAQGTLQMRTLSLTDRL